MFRRLRGGVEGAPRLSFVALKNSIDWKFLPFFLFFFLFSFCKKQGEVGHPMGTFFLFSHTMIQLLSGRVYLCFLFFFSIFFSFFFPLLFVVSPLIRFPHFHVDWANES